MKYNKSLVLFMIFTIIACISIVGSASAAGTGNNTTINTTNTAITTNTTGQSEYKGPQTNATKYTNGTDQGYVTHTKNGTTYAVRGGDLYAISPNGTVLWTYYIDHSGGGEGSAFQNAPTLGPDGTIYMLGGGNLYAINSNGTAKWIYKTGATAYDYGSPVMGANGIIYFANGWTVYGIDTTLTDPTTEDPKYKFDSNGQISGGLTPTSDGKTFYFTTYTGSSVYAIDSTDLTLKWNYDGIKVNTGLNPILGSDGTLYLASYTSPYNIYALNPNGTLKWNYSVQCVYSGIAMAADGTLYFVNVAGGKYQFTALNPNGTLKWNYTLSKQSSTTSPVIGSDGTVYIGTTNGILYAFNPNGTLKWTYNVTGVLTGQNYRFTNYNIDSDSTLSFLVDANNYGTDTYVLFAIQDIVANFTSTPGANPTKVQFHDTSSNTPTSWSWNFGDGATSTEQNPMHQYANAGTYTVTLTVTTAFGDTNTTTQEITVTKDSVPPNVTSKPVHNTPKNTITVKFSEPIQRGSGAIELKDSTGKNVSFKISINGNVLTITPDTTLVKGANYTLTLYNGSITDLSDNNLSVYSTSFTVDGTAPVIITVDPANKTVNVFPNKAIKVTFSEAIQGGNNWIELKDSSGKAVSFTTSISGNVLTITPTIALTKGAKYTLTLHTGCLTDLSGNNLALCGSTFTTDGTAPIIKTIDPAKNAINVPTNKVIKVTFSEAIKAGSGNIELKNSAGKAVSFTKSISGNVLTITPTSLSKGTKYTLTLHTGCLTDLSGNNIALCGSTFTTDGTAPTITAIDPAKNAINVPANKVIKVTLSESVKAGMGSIELKGSNGKAISFTKLISGNTLFIIPNSSLTKGVKYTLTLHTGSLTDLSGNNIALCGSTFTVKK